MQSVAIHDRRVAVNALYMVQIHKVTAIAAREYLRIELCFNIFQTAIGGVDKIIESIDEVV